VDAVDRGDGGVWAVGADGGVFALDAAGNPDSGAFYGSFPGLGAAGGGAAHGNFVRIEADATTGGYALVNTLGERYSFFNPAEQARRAAPPAPPPPAAPPPNTDAELNQLRATLNARGLGSLLDEAWSYYKGPAGGSADAVLDWLPTTAAYQQRFPGMAHLRDKGQAWTEAQYMDYEQRVMDAAHAYGVPSDFVDTGDIGRMIEGDVSLSEAVDRIKLASQAVSSDSDTLAWMRDNLGVNVDKGALMAFYLDTDGDKGPSFVDRQHQFAAAQIGGAAATAGFGAISQAEAQRLEALGYSPEQARAAFGQVAGMHALFDETLSESATGQNLGRNEQLGLVAGSAQAEEAVAKRKAQREATFSGGGGAAQGGLGSAGQR
jgi:hypothetical protein